MQIRQDIVDIFSTFLQFNSDSDGIWVRDPKLKRSMVNSLKQLSEPEISEQFWTLYWHKMWQADFSPLAGGHLSAYLQEVCYWTSRKMVVNFTNGQSVADLFQIAIARTNKLLKGFNLQSNGSLKKYASLAFSNIIKDELRLRREVDICSNWALLCKVSQKKMIESLKNLNLKTEMIDCYILAWQCFKTIYGFTEARGTRKITEPDTATWEKVTKLYNTQGVSQLQEFNSITKPDTLKEWMTKSGKAIRSYLYPKQISVDAPKPGQEDGELLDKLTDNFQASGLTEIVLKEEEEKRKQERNQINQVLMKTLVKLDSSSQQLLQLYYGQGKTQQEIAQQLEMKQYTVSRRLTSHRQSLLLALAQWSQSSLHSSLNTDVLNNLNVILEEWLKIHYNHPELL